MDVKTLSPAKVGRAKPQSRFQRLWAEAEELAEDNETLQAKLESLVDQISNEVGVAEKALGETVRLVVHRQLDFAEKKSLLKWQRTELFEWTEQLLNQLIDMGQIDDELRNRVAVLHARQMGVELDQNSDVAPVEQLRVLLEEYEDDDFFDDEWGEAAYQDYLSREEEQDELEDLLEQMHEQFGEQDDVAPSQPNGKKHHKPALDDTVFKRLFRQTAAALHPDKEIDPKKHSEKHELMSELLRARKERDLITIVRLHKQHASVQSELSTADEQQLEEVLVDYLGQQKDRMVDTIHRSPMHEWVFREFYDNDPATVKRRIKAHIKKIDTRREGLDIFVNRVKTLKALKELLADRYHQKRSEGRWF